ncbi:hypothetical protein DNF23_32540 [Pseudomonas syringae pv. pisi]
MGHSAQESNLNRPLAAFGNARSAIMKNTRYVLTEQPAQLMAPVTLNIEGNLLAELNLYR